jgi:hypothetical protein
LAYFLDALWQKRLRPMDTNQPDYSRVGEDKAISPAQVCSCALDAQASGRQRYELMSPTTLARESQTGSEFSWDDRRLGTVQSTILVIPSEVEESLAFL